MTPARDREAFDQAVARGSDALKQGKLEDATKAFYEALTADPGNTKGLALLGLALFRGNQFAEARSIYEDLVERAPTDASHRLNLGLVYLKLGDGDKAIHALEASRALDPGQGRAVSYLGLAYARAGRYVEAYRSFLLAGQHELASEIEINLTPAERDGINSQLGRTAAPAAAPAPAPSEPRTKPPSAPPRSKPVEPPAPAASEDAPRLSSPEITIIRPEAPDPSGPNPLTVSQQFVLPVRPDPTPVEPTPEHSMVSRAVARAVPSVAAVARTLSGGLAPRPLSELATEDLVRPDDGEDTFELAPGGALTVRISERVFTRLDGVHVTGGDLHFEAAMRRSRGRDTDERFEYLGSSLHVVSGKGYLIAVPTPKQTFAAVRLDDDILYLREDLVFAFESTLRWENGNVPGLRGKLFMVQFRGDGALAMRTTRPLVRVKLPPQGVVYVDADRIAGWIGRVIPRAVVPPAGGPMGAMCVECTGEGIVLVEPTSDEPARATVAAPAPVALAPALIVDPAPEASPELADLGASLADDGEAGGDGSTREPGRDEF